MGRSTREVSDLTQSISDDVKVQLEAGDSHSDIVEAATNRFINEADHPRFFAENLAILLVQGIADQTLEL